MTDDKDKKRDEKAQRPGIHETPKKIEGEEALRESNQSYVVFNAANLITEEIGDQRSVVDDVTSQYTAYMEKKKKKNNLGGGTSLHFKQKLEERKKGGKASIPVIDDPYKGNDSYLGRTQSHTPLRGLG